MYTLAEIDRMRRALFEIEQEWWTEHSEGQERQRARIEDKLRTLMLNGTTPDEIEAHALAIRNEQKVQEGTT